MALADSITHLKALCKECDKEGLERDAIFSKRVISDSSQTLIGAEDIYMPVCRKHYRLLDRYKTKDEEDGMIDLPPKHYKNIPSDFVMDGDGDDIKYDTNLRPDLAEQFMMWGGVGFGHGC